MHAHAGMSMLELVVFVASTMFINMAHIFTQALYVDELVATDVANRLAAGADGPSKVDVTVHPAIILKRDTLKQAVLDAAVALTSHHTNP